MRGQGAGFAFPAPRDALDALLASIEPLGSETVAWSEASGRVLAEAVVADRDSPSCDVSAMDGYAVRAADLAQGVLPVVGEAAIGRPPPPLPAGRALRIFTGGPVPSDADAVVRREDTEEHPDRIRVAPDLRLAEGANIRRRGENVRAGTRVVAPGALLDPAAMTALVSFGVARARVHRRVRVGVLVTGDELREVGADVAPWELRDSNGPALRALLASRPWLALEAVERVADDLRATTDAVGALLERCDALVLTGGVSMGDHDHVPDAVRKAGAEVVFHKLPIRPGKPLLAALGPRGQVILGLPGNPVSVMVTGRRFGVPALARRAGVARAERPRPVLELVDRDARTLGLWWYRIVERVQDGRARLVPNQGSGDLVAAARSDGFVEIPPGDAGAGPWPFWTWR